MLEKTVFIVAAVLALWSAWAKGCGESPAVARFSHLDDRIIGGQASDPTDWPFVVGIVGSPWGSVRRTKGCTGSLVHARWILTARHCIDEANFRFVVGVREAGVGVEETPFLPNTTAFVRNGASSDDTKSLDIALIHLPQPLNASASTVCLSRSLLPRPGDTVIAVGYGQFNNGTEIVPLLKPLREVVTLVKETCPTELPFKPERELCTGAHMRGPFHGDSGGPLLSVHRGRFFQVGVTSRGFPSLPEELQYVEDLSAVFTKVAFHCDWIEETTGGEVRCLE